MSIADLLDKLIQENERLNTLNRQFEDELEWLRKKLEELKSKEKTATEEE